MFHDKRIQPAATGPDARWIRPCSHNPDARRRAEDISARLVAALTLARPMMTAGFDLSASVTLTAAEGGGVLRFRCLPDQVLCFCGPGDEALLVTPVTGRPPH